MKKLIRFAQILIVTAFFLFIGPNQNVNADPGCDCFTGCCSWSEYAGWCATWGGGSVCLLSKPNAGGLCSVCG